MSVWGSGDAEYFRAAIFRGSYTFRMARIETFSGRSGCQGTGLFLFFLPSFTSWQLSLINDDSLLEFSYFCTIFFLSTHLPFLTFVMRNKWLFPFSLARTVKNRHDFQCAVSCMWMDQWNQSGLTVQCPLSPAQSNHVWHSGLFFQRSRNQGW